MYKHEEVVHNLVHLIAMGAAGDDGQFTPGARLPSETELAAHHQVSVPTVRRALATLEQAKIVTRTQGRGTFVTPNGPELAGHFTSPLEQLFSEAASNAADTAVTVYGQQWFHPQGALGATEKLSGTRATQSRAAAHYELLGRALELLTFGENQYVNTWVTFDAVNIEWLDGAPSLDKAIHDLMPTLPYNEGGIPGMRIRKRTAGRADLFWILKDPPIHLALRRQDSRDYEGEATSHKVDSLRRSLQQLESDGRVS